MKAKIQLTETELKAAICGWLLREYGLSVNATNDITINEYIEEWLGDPQMAPVRPETRYGAEINIHNIQLRKK